MQSLGKIVQRAPAVGAKMWCLFFCFCFFLFVFFTGRMPQSGKQPVLNLLIGQKSGFSPAGATRCTDSLQKLAGPTGTWVRLAVQNFTSVGAEGGNAASEI